MEVSVKIVAYLLAKCYNSNVPDQRNSGLGFSCTTTFYIFSITNFK
ncbi:hypothetical protein RT717_03915 [Imperialibacter roseus]|uniref:Uncharacterized protein n=1 Tax=Imperialibacter roseus TaxID=1324217 RepID=A0ABZ0IRW9_9BACT|nr:hypothetical protein [Imperialibacter roseus]WOK07770.1 hypothetical protein RT717_03915 [Imperialibacter roseus]